MGRQEDTLGRMLSKQRTGITLSPEAEDLEALALEIVLENQKAIDTVFRAKRDLKERGAPVAVRGSQILVASMPFLLKSTGNGSLVSLVKGQQVSAALEHIDNDEWSPARPCFIGATALNTPAIKDLIGEMIARRHALSIQKGTTEIPRPQWQVIPLPGQTEELVTFQNWLDEKQEGLYMPQPRITYLSKKGGGPAEMNEGQIRIVLERMRKLRNRAIRQLIDGLTLKGSR